MAKKIICFSLWGFKQIYEYGLLENAILAQNIFPDWTVRVYYSECSDKIFKQLTKFDNVELIKMCDTQSCFSNTF